MSGPVFLTHDQVVQLHRRSLEQHGGQDGVRDVSALDAAVMHPRNVYYYQHADLFDIAAAYAFHLAQSQAFLDGNKRTGMAAALVFLKLNGVTLPRATEALHEAMTDIALRKAGKPELAVLFRNLNGRV